MKVVIQEEKTGCGIASVANVLGLSYAELKQKANSIGIFADDDSLYSDTNYVRKLLHAYGVKASSVELPFESWEKLPNLALLSIKYHEEAGRPFWHWVVFKHHVNGACVLDSAVSLNGKCRTDFSTMKPKWFIEIMS
jgi:ABC-type bacteriocin/lantibiotic exporter with double-glycine peptidase domain